MTHSTILRTTLSVPVLLAFLLLALAVAPASAQPPPMNRSYEISFVMPPIGDDDQEEADTDCLTFTEDELCIAGLGECAPWYFHLVIDEKRPAFKSIFRFTDDEGVSIDAHMRGFTERRGNPGSSIGGVVAVAASLDDVREVVNFGFSGRSVDDCSAFEGSSE